KSAELFDFRITREDFSLENNPEERLEFYLQQKNSIAFNLEYDALIRASLIKLKTTEHVFFLSMHHIIGDGWSMELLMSEIVKSYNALISGKQAALPVLTIQYKDYAVWLKEELQQQKHQESEKYWLDQFSGELPVLDLPNIAPRPLVQTYTGDRVSHEFSPEFLGRLKAFSQEKDVTLFMTLMAGVNILLHRYTGQHDIIVGTPVAGREHPDLENQLGLYLNTLAIRTTLQEGMSFSELLVLEKETLLGAYEHQGYPFDALIGKLSLSRDTSRSALFDVLVALQNQTQLKNLNTEELNSLEVKGHGVKSKISKFDMSFTFVETNGLGLVIEYNTDIYDSYLIERMFWHLENILSACVSDPETSIEKIDYLTAIEKEELLNGFNNTKADYPQDKTIIDLFEQQVLQAPD
ncbi:condensation domain-containing protein, partial [Flavobacterium sp. FlaQc-51]|uniref:condensation domain-containing protein n=1 Tax=Flavobacterium sp. FlaQc-51 TaxID=3374184 RepID=UPI0037578C2F